MEKRNTQPQTQANQQNSSPLGTANSKKPNLNQSEGAAVRSRNSGTGVKKSNSSNSQTNGSNNTLGENDTFNKHYNKELRVSKDEIPIVLAELNDSAIQFIKREQYDKALNLLQKAYGIMDVVDFNLCKRDQFHLFILFHNMALCYQKIQCLEECASCIEQALEHLPKDQFNLQEKSISNRMKKLQILCKLKMQYCAILSQIHRHKDALTQAKESVKLSHVLINDLKCLCEFYVKREEIDQNYFTGLSKQNLDEVNNYNSYGNLSQDRQKYVSSRNKSFSQFLSQNEYLDQNNISVQIPNPPFKKEQSSQALSSFYNLNHLEESMSYLEKTAKKLLPILIEVKKKMLKEKSKPRSSKSVTKLPSKHESKEDLDLEEDDENDFLLSDDKKPQVIDMKNILGYLNQGEWTATLSIGSIMQLQPFTLKDLLEQGKNELEMSRDSFIQKISYLAVSYFCYSTEIRFIMQMKEDPTWDPAQKQKESEFWHAKALELACTFMPGECPLLNHINLSYQKHFAPVKQTINEEEVIEDDLRVIKPLQGIENQKFQPIIRAVQNVQVAITPYQITPVNQVTKGFLKSMIQFNDYQEQQQLSQMQSVQQQNKNSQLKSGVEIIKGEEGDDVQQFEKLFEKLLKENKIDKHLLLQKLGVSSKKDILDEGDMHDALLDEQILQDEESYEEGTPVDPHHQSSNSNLYKFKNQDIIMSERPKTSNNFYKNFGSNKQLNEILPTGDQGLSSKVLNTAKQNSEDRAAAHKKQLIEQSKKRAQRPLSGNLSRVVKTENSTKSRINKMNQNFSMFDKLGNQISPDKNMSEVERNLLAQFASQGHIPKNPNKSFESGSQQYFQNQLNSKNLIERQLKGTQQNTQAYDELKKRLLAEYKKLCNTKKTFDDQLRERYKNIQKQGRGNSGKKLPINAPTQTNQGSTQSQPNLNSQNSPKHLNVYKPTFIINNSFTGEQNQKELDSEQKRIRAAGQKDKSELNSASVSKRSTHHERHNSSLAVNQNQILSSQGLGVEKKQSQSSGNTKKHSKQVSQPNMPQDMNFIKQFLQDKTNAGKISNQLGVGHQYMNPTQMQGQLQSALYPQQNRAGQDSAGGKRQHSRKQSTNNSSGVGTNQHSFVSGQNQAVKQQAYEKMMKKKLNNQPFYSHI